MSTITKTICDNCGKEKGDVNHWFRLALHGDYEGDLGICIWPFEAPTAQERPSKNFTAWTDVCGQDCAMQFVSRFLSTGKVGRS